MIKGLIFDLDGTTLNTLEDIVRSYNLALKEFGFSEKSEDEIRMGVGQGFMMLVNNTIPKEVDAETKERLANRYKEIYKENYDRKTCPYNGMRELLEKLQYEGYKLAVNSNKSDIFVKSLISKNYPEIVFTDVMGAVEGIAHKPDPQGPEIIIKEMGLNKEEVLYVGDSDIDIKTAKNTGLKSIGCLWGFRDEETLKNAGVDVLVSEPSQILEYLKGEV